MLRGSLHARLVDSGRHHRVFIALTLVVAQLFFWLGVVPSSNAAPVPQTVDLKVLVIDNDDPWVDAFASQMTVEGIPFTALPVLQSGRPAVTDSFLYNGDHAFYQAVVLANYEGGGLTAAELTTLRAFEAKFGIREIDGYNWANPAVGLNYASAWGDLSPITATVTPAGLSNGFQYLNGPVPIAKDSYTWLATPLPMQATGDTYTTLVSAPIPNSTESGSLVGVYTSGGVERMIITMALNVNHSHFKMLAHGMLTWATKGVHLGYNRNRMTFHVDDAFSSVALWDPEHNCTPGEDCPRNSDGSSIYPESTIRLTPEDIDFAVQWSATNNYALTIAYNGFYAAADDPLTQSLVANKSAFRWLNHGLEHLYQGCIQDFTVSPWRCTTDASGNIVWLDQATIANEINGNIAVANTYGLPINPTEYLSGEHSGLFLTPQQPVDNPNFVAAVTASGLLSIGADASREAAPRNVGSATTAPRHPTILYYNTATRAQAVDEYNWLYSTRANGGSGYCEDNPATATCVPPASEADFLAKIIPSDAAFNLSFILSNDPRPFYAHTSNMGADRIMYPLLESILGTYRSSFNANAPLQNLTLTEVSNTFRQQNTWAMTGMSATPQATASITAGTITINNTGTSQVPLTVPNGTTVAGATLESYGGEMSGWLGAAPTTTATLQGIPAITLGSPNLVVGTAGTFTMSATGTPVPTISVTGALPAGMTFTGGAGNASIAGTPTTAGDYPISVTATNSVGSSTVAATLKVMTKPAFTSAASVSVGVGKPLNFTVTTTGTPAAAITRSGTLPSGVTFTANANGTATFAGTPTVAGTFAQSLTATNLAGTATQTFTLTVVPGPAFTSAATATVGVGKPLNFTVTTTGTPAAAITRTGTLPSGVTFTANANGTATFTGTPTVAGTYSQTLTATNVNGTATQTFVITVTPPITFTTAAAATFTVGTTSSYTIRATGAPLPSMARTGGTLPAGVTFVDNGNGVATLSGRPAARTGGTYTFTITASNTGGSTTQTFVLTVRQAPAFTSPSTVLIGRNRTINVPITTTGSPAATLTKTGNLPSGLVFTANANGTASITGRTSSMGLYMVTVRATNTAGTATQVLLLLVL